MSDLRPRGTPIVIDGVERHFLFTLNVIDTIQDKTGKSMREVMSDLTNAETVGKTVGELVLVLINDEVERERYKNPDSVVKEVTEKEVGWMVGMDNLGEITSAILIAYGCSLPEPDDEDPNLESGQQSS